MVESFERRFQEHLAGIDGGPFGKMLVYEAECTSTNDIAHALAADGAAEGTLVISDYQTAGRGRLERSWEADRGTSILASLIFRPRETLPEIYRYVIATGLAIAQAIEAETTLKIEVKWPNDLLIAGRKFAGILAESTLSGKKLEWLIIGIGINIRQRYTSSQPLYGKATSLALEGCEIDSAILLAIIMGKLNSLLPQPDDDLLRQWRQRMTMLGKRIEIEQHHQVLRGLTMDITGKGELLLDIGSDSLEKVAHGDATVIQRRRY